MKKNLVKFSLLLLSLVFATVSLVACGGGGGGGGQDTVKIVADSYPGNAKNATITVDDLLVVSSVVSVTVTGGSKDVTLSFNLDENGKGAAEVDFADLLVSAGDKIIATYIDGKGSKLRDSATITAAVTEIFASDDNLDGKVYLYATDSKTEIDFDDDTMLGDGNGDFLAIWEWSGSAELEGNYTEDTKYAKVFKVTPGVAGWSSVVWASGDERSFADDFMTDLAENFSALHFKFKGEDYSTVKVVFNGANEVVLRITSGYATDLGDGWYSYSLPLAIFGDMNVVTDIAFITDGANDWFLTDVYFDDSVITVPSYTDLEDDGKYWIKSGNGDNQIDLEYGSAYTSINDWGTGGGNPDAIDAIHGDVWIVTPGWGWSWGPVGVLAFSGFDPLFATNFTTLNFKYKPNSYDYVNVKFPGSTAGEGGAGEITFLLADHASQIGTTEWYEVSISLDAFGALNASTEFGIVIYGADVTSTAQVTDVYFE